MYNDILTIGPVTIHGYGLMIGIGILVAFLVAGKRAKNRGLSEDSVYSLGLCAVLFGMLGAKILFCIVNFKEFLANPRSFFSLNGFVVYGGIIGGILAAMVYCKIKKLKFLEYFDLVMPSVALAQGFGRIGCFLAGCCYGKETDSVFGIVFHNSKFAPNGVKLIPTQLISSAGNFLIALFLILYARKERKSGEVGAWYLILYSAGRFGVEFLRNDYRGEVFGILSTSQFISIFTFALGIILLILFRKKGKNIEPGKTDENVVTK